MAFVAGIFNEENKPMRVLVLNPMTQKSKNIIRDVVYGCWCNGKRIGGATVPPFILVTISSLLRRDGINTDFLDAQAEQVPPEQMSERIKAYDVVVMSTSTMTFQEDANYLLGLKRCRPGLLTVLFGSHATFMPRYCLAHTGVDIIVKHDPEWIIRDLMLLIAEGKDYGELKGIGYRGPNGVVINDDHPEKDNLNNLPIPDVDLLPKRIDYFNPIVKRTPYMTTSTSRGCPAKCTFCTAPTFHGTNVRFQSAERVIEEIEYYVKKGIKEIYFRDDTFFVNKKRDLAIFDHIIKNKIDVTWIANARVGLMDENTMKMAKLAGCHTIKFGIESGLQEILDGMKKGYKIERALEIFDLTRKYGVKTHAHIMLGNPGDSRASIEETIKFALRLDPTTATFGICTPYPGTPLFSMVQEKYPEIGDGSSSDLSNLHVKGLFNEHFTSLKKEELRDMVFYAYRKFYLRPSYWLKSFKTQVTGLDDIKRLSIAATNIFSFIASREN
jgi:anaerobic magnesium-protoporphyrin IX monomethyl ester cyclase